MENKKQKNRWLVLLCICCNTFCFGGVYAWSAFSGELAAYMGWDYSKVTLAYSVMLMTIAAMGLVGGALLQRFARPQTDDCGRDYVGAWLVRHRLCRKRCDALYQLRHTGRLCLRLRLQSGGGDGSELVPG